jgi:hypothetical protein
VKTLQAVVNAQHKNRACSLGDSCVRYQRFARINVARERAAEGFSHSQVAKAIEPKASSRPAPAKHARHNGVAKQVLAVRASPRDMLIRPDQKQSTSIDPDNVGIIDP